MVYLQSKYNPNISHETQIYCLESKYIVGRTAVVVAA